MHTQNKMLDASTKPKGMHTTNARSMANKMNKFELLLLEEDFDRVSET